ncbi:MAG: hypothetical protein AAF772_14895 [Acidobacteriota bacterium]
MSRTRWLLIVGGLVAVATLIVGVALALRGVRAVAPAAEPAWTTDDPAARDALVQGIDAWRADRHFAAASHLRRAMDHDPGLVAAAVLLQPLAADRTEARQLAAQLRRIDDASLNDVEGFLLRHWRAVDRPSDEAEREIALAAGLDDDDPDAARADAARAAESPEAVVEAFLGRHPDNPFGLLIGCETYWRAGRRAQAESACQRLIARHPRWVGGQHLLGALAMADGAFEEAERRLVTYQFLAPDQPQPHLALAELHLLRGRWRRALQGLDAALATAPEHCPTHIARLRGSALAGDVDRVEKARARLAASAEPGAPCAERLPPRMVCYHEVVAALYLGRAAEAADRLFVDDCLPSGRTNPVAVRLALARGDDARADQLLTALRTVVRDADSSLWNREIWQGILDHVEAMTALARADDAPDPAAMLASAADRFAAADARVPYWRNGLGLTKLFIRLEWAHTLRRLGRIDEARAIEAELDAVNPRLRQRFAEDTIDRLRVRLRPSASS